MASFKAPTLVLPSKKLIFIPLAIFAAIVGGWWALMASIFNEEEVQKEVIAALSQALGYTVTVEGRTVTSAFPIPTLTMDNVSIGNDKRADDGNLLRLDSLTVKLAPLALLGGDVQVNATLVAPKVYLQTFEDGTHSWETVRAPTASDSGDVGFSSITIVDGDVTYVYPAIQRRLNVKSIDASLKPEANGLEASGTLALYGDPFRFTWAHQKDEGAAASTFDLTLADDVSDVAFSGKWNGADRTLEGTQTIKSTDLGRLLETVFQKKHKDALADAERYPLTITSRVALRQDRLELDNLSFDGTNAKGKGSLIAILGAQPQIQTRLQMDEFGIGVLNRRGIFSDLVAKPEEQVTEFAVETPEGKQKVLPDGVTFALSLRADKGEMFGLPASNIGIAAQLKNAALAVQRWQAILPGETQLVVTGNAAGSFDGLALRGRADVYGKKLSALMPYFGLEALKIPERMEEFRGRANLYLSPASQRFSEGIFQTAEIQALGTVLIDTADPAKPVTDISAKVVNLDADRFLDLQVQNNKDQLPSVDQTRKWFATMLGGLDDKTYRVNLALDNAIILGESIPSLNAKLTLTDNTIDADNLVTRFKGMDVIGDAKVVFPPDQEPLKPAVDADIRLGVLDTGQFMQEGDLDEQMTYIRGETGKGNDWSEKEFDFGFLHQFNGTVSMTIDRLVHGKLELDKVKMKAAIDGFTTTIEQLTAAVWGGQLQLKASMQTGKLPSLNGDFRLENINLLHLHQFTDIYDNLEGSLSLAGQLQTSGFNMASAVRNSQGAMAVAARRLIINGFDVAKLVRAANEVRVATDINKIVEFANQGGQTVIDVLQGSAAMANGQLSTPGMAISTEVASGNIKGQINFLEWKMNVAVNLFLSALQKKDPPSIRLVFDGPLDSTTRNLDTQSLETFVAKTAAQRLLSE